MGCRRSDLVISTPPCRQRPLSARKGLPEVRARNPGRGVERLAEGARLVDVPRHLLGRKASALPCLEVRPATFAQTSFRALSDYENYNDFKDYKDYIYIFITGGYRSRRPCACGTRPRASSPASGFLVSGFWFLVSGFWFLVSGFLFRVESLGLGVRRLTCFRGNSFSPLRMLR